MVKIFRLSLIASVALLVGCGGGDDEDISFRPTPSTPTPMLAMDGFATVTPNKESFIDLSPFVRGTEVSISSIKVDSDNEQCGKPTLSGTGVKVDITAGTFCQYTYTAAQTGLGQAQAALNVLATSAVQATLPPLSEALVVGTASTSFNVQTLLTNIGVWKSTYRLDTSSVTVHGMEGNLGSVDNVAGNSFNFTPPDLSGWNRIVFTLIDSNAPSAPVMGVLYVTISEAVNQPPSISEPKYDYNANNPSASVVVGERVTLNLASLPGLSITEPDNQDWQLVKALSWAATVDATNPNSLTNKSIDFTASSMGDHYVTYIVADHYGGYASGLIKITVGVKNDPSTWDDIKTGGKTFLAPDTYVQATNKGMLTTPEWDNGVNNTVAGYTSTAGQSYCNTVGTLPTTAEMGALYAGPEAELAKWPKEKLYLATEGVNYKSYNLQSGTASNYNAATAHYVTCVQAPTMKLELLLTNVIADGEVHNLAKVTMPHESDEFYITKAGGTLDERDVNIEKGAKSGNVTTLTTSSTTAGTYSFTVTNANDISEQLTSGEITYEIPKVNLTATIVAARGYPNGITATPITVTLVDDNYAPYEQGNITIKSNNATDTITPESVAANEYGEFTTYATYTSEDPGRAITVEALQAESLEDAVAKVAVRTRLGSTSVSTDGSYTLALEATEHLTNAERAEDIEKTTRATVTASQEYYAMRFEHTASHQHVLTVTDESDRLGIYTTKEECWEVALQRSRDTQSTKHAAYVQIGHGATAPDRDTDVDNIANSDGACTLFTRVWEGSKTPEVMPRTLITAGFGPSTATATGPNWELSKLEECVDTGVHSVTYASDRIEYRGTLDAACSHLQTPANWDVSEPFTAISINLTNNLGVTLGTLPPASQ